MPTQVCILFPHSSSSIVAVTTAVFFITAFPSLP
jgi:hypothetical protein